MKLLVIDPFVATRAPTMRSWILALPSFRDLFSEIEIWATECDVPEGNGVIWKRVKKRIPVTTLHMVDFQWRVSRMIRKHPPASDTVVMTTGCNIPRADIHYMHYWNRAMLEEQRKRADAFHLQPHHRLVASLVARTEAKVACDPVAERWWWSVSRSISEKIKADGATGHFRILPNPYDSERFHPEIRNHWRAEMRRFYGFHEDEVVFVFSSFGHFERKGLLQGIEALAILRKKGYPVRLLVLGGSSRTIERFRVSLGSRRISSDFCHFAGLVSPIEQHLSAADALLFPSHFEAFSLAEIEAGALGLRLYLTAHYGSEMILREPENGRLLPWEPAGMAAVIEEDLKLDRVGLAHTQTGEAVTLDEFSHKIRSLFEEIIAAKKRAVQAT